MLLKGVNIEKPEDMENREAANLVIDEYGDISAYSKIVIQYDAEDEQYVTMQAFKRSPITRIRRVSGYLSSDKNFNDAKKAELRDRVKHMII